MFTKAIELFFAAPRTTRWDHPKCTDRPCPTDRETAYKIHLGQWSRYR